jgi:hypothetical protein
MNMQMQHTKECFRQWWSVMQTMQAKYGNPVITPAFAALPEYPLLYKSYRDLLSSLHTATGLNPFLFERTLLMAMERVLDPDVVLPSETELDKILEISVAFAASAQQQINNHEGQPPN